MFWVFSKQQGQLQEGPEPQGAWPPQGLPCCMHLWWGLLERSYNGRLERGIYLSGEWRMMTRGCKL